MNDTLVTHLDTVDERLHAYLDDDDEMSLDAVCRLREYTDALLHGSITTVDLAEAWPDFYDLAPAFVAAYAPAGMEDLEEAAAFLDGPEVGDDAPLTGADRAYLVALERLLDMYPEMWLGEGE